MFTELYREEKREEGDRRGQGDKSWERKGGRQIQLVISSLSVLHRLENTDRFSDLSREEEGKGGYRGDLGEKRESQKGRKQSSQ